MGSFPEKLIRLAQEQKLGTRGLQVLLEHIPVNSIIILIHFAIFVGPNLLFWPQLFKRWITLSTG